MPVGDIEAVNFRGIDNERGAGDAAHGVIYSILGIGLGIVLRIEDDEFRFCTFYELGLQDRSTAGKLPIPAK